MAYRLCLQIEAEPPKQCGPRQEPGTENIKLLSTSGCSPWPYR